MSNKGLELNSGGRCSLLYGWMIAHRRQKGIVNYTSIGFILRVLRLEKHCPQAENYWRYVSYLVQQTLDQMNKPRYFFTYR